MKELKINIDDFSTPNEFGYKLFNEIKNKKFFILVYGNNYRKDFYIYIKKNIITYLEKLVNNKLVVKFINFPICFIDDELILKKYFIIDLFYHIEDKVIKKNINCLTCKYYFLCTFEFYMKELNSIKKFDSVNFIETKYFFSLLAIIREFFVKIGIEGNDILFEIPYDGNTSVKYISKSFLKNIRINILFKNSKYNKIFIDTGFDNFYEIIPNLFFKNYIFQKRFNFLLKKNGISSSISFYKGNISLYIRNTYNLNLLYRTMNLVELSRIGILNQKKLVNKIFYGKVGYGDGNIALSYININSINSIDNNFSKYVVGIQNTEINKFIPHIYNFKYFLSSHSYDTNSLIHYKIVFREIGAFYIDNIDSNILMNLEPNSKLNINFNTGSINILG